MSLDDISKKLDDVQHELEDYFWVSKGISICFTPLHAVPWTEQSVSNDMDLSPKAFLLEQVMKRLKNAISIDFAATLHFPPKSNEVKDSEETKKPEKISRRKSWQGNVILFCSLRDISEPRQKGICPKLYPKAESMGPY